MRKDIANLTELEAEQEKIEFTMEFTRLEFTRSLLNSQYKLKGFLLEKVAIPVGAIGLGMVAVKQVFGSSGEKTKQAPRRNLLAKLFPMALSLVQVFFQKEQNENH